MIAEGVTSYYGALLMARAGLGNVLGLLLDARIRRATDGRRSLDDLMRLAYQR